MTPKEKAEELVEKYSELYDYGSLAKDSALIAIDEIIKELDRISETYWIDLTYWQEVKQEIEKL